MRSTNLTLIFRPKRALNERETMKIVIFKILEISALTPDLETYETFFCELVWAYRIERQIPCTFNSDLTGGYGKRIGFATPKFKISTRKLEMVAVNKRPRFGTAI